MSNNKLLISEKFIKENSILDENLESKIVSIAIKQVQNLKLKPLLGDKKYQEIIDEYLKKVNDSTYQIDEEIKTLKEDYINDFLIYGVLLEITTSLNYKFTNKGTKTISDASAETINLGEIESVKKYYRAKFDAYKLRLIEYLSNREGVNIPSSGKGGYNTGFYIKPEPNYIEIAKARANKTGRRF
ncbi:DUF6712 family protein [Sphingobacterium cellulitidis]|uniref:Uncharacterized protein n=1 Tax=Sphingobacterium cellulitidis TaxID=1768011 RepID=A0A8H9G4H0_9SPHI|nr:hypothetical protein [Sphingobacterium soli]MBA8985960.1 hypothetical protein [Sphingobacterium soli]GGE28254.1 hypothetical protein GCM10011516_27410 [Sphingobacterium soli]